MIYICCGHRAAASGSESITPQVTQTSRRGRASSLVSFLCVSLLFPFCLFVCLCLCLLLLFRRGRASAREVASRGALDGCQAGPAQTGPAQNAWTERDTSVLTSMRFRQRHKSARMSIDLARWQACRLRRSPVARAQSRGVSVPPTFELANERFAGVLNGTTLAATANLRTKILDFRGFGSSGTLIVRGGIIVCIRNSPESLSQPI